MKDTYNSKARSLRPRAEWFEGSGRWAIVSDCGGQTTVVMAPTTREAWQARKRIDLCGCGGACQGKTGHIVFDLDRPMKVRR